MKCDYIEIGKNHVIELSNDTGLKVYLTKTGASIYAIYLNDHLMTLTPESLDDFYKPTIYYGKTIGPISGRVKDGILEAEGKTFTLSKNEGNNSLHSGKRGIHAAVFEVAELKCRKDLASVIFKFEPKKDCSDIPGKTVYFVGYSLQKDRNELEVSINAYSEADFPFAMTNHSYFTLGEESVDNLTLTIPAHHFIETAGKDLLPVKEVDILPCLDFNSPKLISKDINNEYLMNHRSKGYDHLFVLDKKEITLESDKYKMVLTCDYPLCVIYTDNYEDHVKMEGTMNINRRGVAIEPVEYPFNRKLTPKGTIYSRFIKYSFSEK